MRRFATRALQRESDARVRESLVLLLLFVGAAVLAVLVARGELLEGMAAAATRGASIPFECSEVAELGAARARP